MSARVNSQPSTEILSFVTFVNPIFRISSAMSSAVESSASEQAVRYPSFGLLAFSSIFFANL